MGVFDWLRGTLESMWNVGGAGTAANPAWKANGAAFEAVLGDDSGFTITRGLAPVGPDDYTQKAYVDAADAVLAAAIAAVSAGVSRARTLPFGRNIAVPALGNLQLAAPGTSLVGYRMDQAGIISAASIQVDAADPVRSYDLEIRKNGIAVATLALPALTTGAQTAALAVAVVAGDVITAFLVLTGGAGASTFGSETAMVKVT